MPKTRINVFARVRPSKEKIVQRVVAIKDDSSITLASNKMTFHFDRVYGEDSKQEEVFDGVASQIVQGTLQGFNGTIFAYGQTGSGKTHTMIGPSTSFNNNSGIIPRGLQLLFEELDKKAESMPGKFESNITMTFVEIHKESINDLFIVNNEKLEIGQDVKGKVFVKGATEVFVKDLNDAMQEVMNGWNGRKVAETTMNRASSRSHALLMIKIHTVESHGTVSTSRSAFLNLVDLAGSERVSESKVEGYRLDETKKINLSLHNLARVIRNLPGKKEGEFVPYRDSKLTYILSDSLGGNSRTAFIINIHPDRVYASNTLASLNFSTEVRRIENKVVANEKLEGDSAIAFTAEIIRLKDEIEKRAVDIDIEKKAKEELTEQINRLTKELADNEMRRKEEIDELRSQLEKSREKNFQFEGNAIESCAELKMLRKEMEKSIEEERKRANSALSQLKDLRELWENEKMKIEEERQTAIELKQHVLELQEELERRSNELENERRREREDQLRFNFDNIGEGMENLQMDRNYEREVEEHGLNEDMESDEYHRKDSDETEDDEDAEDVEVKANEGKKIKEKSTQRNAKKRVSHSNIEKRSQWKWSDTEMECPLCEFRTKSVKSWLKHLQRQHLTNPTKARVALLCECGHEGTSQFHSMKCKVANFTVISRRYNGTPKCILCHKYPKTSFAYTQHFYRDHNSTLRAQGIYVKCLCGTDIHCHNGRSHLINGKKCGGRQFSVHRLDERLKGNRRDNEWSGEDEDGSEEMEDDSEEEEDEEEIETDGSEVERTKRRNTQRNRKINVQRKKKSLKKRISYSKTEKMTLSKKSDSDLECPLCEYRSKSVSSWLHHLKRKHSTNPTKVGVVLLCECGHTGSSDKHCMKCNIANFTVIPRRDKGTPMCVLCNINPRSAEAYAKHLYAHHKSSLTANGIFIKCSCGLDIHSYGGRQYPNHRRKCNGLKFSIHRLDERPEGNPRDNEWSEEDEEQGEGMMSSTEEKARVKSTKKMADKNIRKKEEGKEKR